MWPQGMYGNPFLSGNPFVSGADQFVSGPPEFLSGDGMYGTMSDIAGMDPVSAMLGLEDIAGYGDMSGYDGMMGYDPMMGWNPLNLVTSPLRFAGRQLNRLNPFASRGRRGGPSPQVAAAINSKMLAHGAGVVERKNTRARRYPCPLPATPVAGGASATIAAQPQALYRPERLVIAASIAPSFSVTDIKVGNVSQIPNTGEIPGELFAQNGVDCTIELDTVNPALNLLVVVTNITGGTLTFRGAFIGTNVQ